MKKKLGYIFLALIFLPCLFLMSACNTGESNEIKVEFAELKSIVSTDIDDWQGLNVSMTKAGKEIASFKSIKNESYEAFDFVYENSEKKVFCEDGISYYEESNRNYIVEDGNEYELFLNEVIKDNIQVVNNFFDNISNKDSLKSSDKQEIADGTKYEFESLLDIVSGLKMSGEYSVDTNGNITKIIINVISNEGTISSEIIENKNHITTPEWFDNNDYKVDMTASEIKEMVTDKTLFENWETIEIFYPKELTNTDDTIVFVDKNSQQYYKTCGNEKLYADNKFVYKYINDLACSKNDISMSTAGSSGALCTSFNFDDNISYMQDMIAGLFDELSDNCVAGKKYYKDETIVSYKFVVDEGDFYNDVIVSLYFDLNNELYWVDVYTSYKSVDENGNIIDGFETNIYFKKSIWENPSWFKKTDFSNYYTYSEIENIMTQCKIDEWDAYKYSGEVLFGTEDDEQASFKENAVVLNSGRDGELCFWIEKTVDDSVKDEYEYCLNNSSNWDFEKSSDSQNVFVKNSVQYSYKNNVAFSKTDIDNESYFPGLYNSAFGNTIISIVNGNVPSKIVNTSWITSETNIANILIPGADICFNKCSKINVASGSAYKVSYTTNIQVGREPLIFEYVVYLDENGEFEKIEFTSNVFVDTKKANITTFVFEKYTEEINAPEWFDEEEFIHTHIFSNWTIVDGIKQKNCGECGDILCKLHYDYENNIITLDKNGDIKTYAFGKSSGRTTDPTIKVFPTYVDWNPADGQDFVEVYFPTVWPIGDFTEVVYHVTGPNGEHPAVEDIPTNDGVKMFRATSQGRYTLQISYIEENGDFSAIEKEIRIGDCESPIIEWVNEDGDLILETSVNTFYRLNVYESLIFIDNQTKEDELLNNVDVRLTAPDGETVTNIGNDLCYEWEFKKVGNYTLRITVKDNAGNSNRMTYTISVKSFFGV